ncbi:hypothetical protein GCM10028789_14330 [Sinomonas halotolerans]
MEMRMWRFWRSPSTERLHWSGSPTHSMGRDPAMPNLAAAQIPGPGSGRAVLREGQPVEVTEDPYEKEGHLPAHHGRHRKG